MASSQSFGQSAAGAQGRSIQHSDLARNPTTFVGMAISVTGQVVQVVEDGRSVIMRVNVTPGPHGIWSDTVWVDYEKKRDNDPRTLEKDIIAIHGEFKGVKSYTTIFGATQQIPHIAAHTVNPMPTIIRRRPGGGRL